MLGDEKNLKDTSQNSVKDIHIANSSNQGTAISFGTYTKVYKLITALYMVTDIIHETEPLRNKLRTLGNEVISDIYSISTFPGINGQLKASSKITETVSFLDIASTVKIISEMNCNILKKEFFELRKAIDSSIPSSHILNNGAMDLSHFFAEELPSINIEQRRGDIKSIGHGKPTRIGVQKGGTLMKALSDKTSILSDTKSNNTVKENDAGAIKKERQEEIVSIIKSSSVGDSIPIGLTITDIKSRAKGPLVACGEKTLQRMLVSMVEDNVLYKTGSKRWSRYYTK